MLLALLAALGGTIQSAQADSGAWDGSSSAIWSDVTNWSSEPNPVPGTGNTATFNSAGNGNTTIDLGVGVTINTIQFDTGSAAAYTIGSGAVNSQTLTLNSGGTISMTNTVAQNQTVNASLVNAGSLTLNNASGNTLTIAGNVASSASSGTLTKSGSGLVTLSGTNNWVTSGNSATFNVYGGGELRLTGGLNEFNRSGSTGRPRSFIGGDSALNYSGNNIMRLESGGRMVTAGITIGGGTYTAGNLYGNNALIISTPGTSGSKTWASLGQAGSELFDFGESVLGFYTDNNSIQISNGAYADIPSNNKSFYIGYNRPGVPDGNGNFVGQGGNNNYVLVTGSSGGNPSTFNRTSSSFTYVGYQGNANYIEILNGALMNSNRTVVGAQGDNNYIRINGANSKFDGGGSNTLQVGGNGSGGSPSGNYVLIENSGRLNLVNNNTNRDYTIGGATNASDNYIRVTGAGSIMEFREETGLWIGRNRTADQTGTLRNYLSIENGSTTSIFNHIRLGGGDGTLANASKVKLGNGGTLAAMEIRSLNNANLADKGINLEKADTRLEINNGRLIAGQNTQTPAQMVQGLGRVDIMGPAYFSTVHAGSRIDSVIEDSTSSGGTITKEGSGTLSLTAANTYAGATAVTVGTLALTGSGDLGGTAVTVSGGGATLLVNKESGNTTIGTAGNASVSINSGGVLSLLSTSQGINTLTINRADSGNTALTLSNGSTIKLDINFVGQNDQILVGSDDLVSAGNFTVNFTQFLAPPLGTYTLISAPGGGLPVAGTGVSITGLAGYGFDLLSSTSTALILSLNSAPAPTITGNGYFQGDLNASWATYSAPNTNWAADSLGTFEASAVPGTATDVHFYTTNATLGNLNTTLDQAFTIKTLTMDGGALTNSVSIAPGTGGSLTINNAGGITSNAGAGALTITAPVTLGVTQTWTNNSSNTITLSGGITGGANGITKAGTGTISIGSTNTFGALTVNAGNFNITGGTNTWVGTTVQTTGTLNVSGGTNDSGASDNVIQTGTVNFSGGTLTSAGSLLVGNAAGTTAALNLSNNAALTLTNSAKALNIGQVGTGTTALVTMSGTSSINTSTNEVNIGNANGANGTLTMSGSSVFTQANAATLGFYVGRGPTNTATFNIQDSAILNANRMTVALQGTGIVNQTGGTINLTVGGATNNWRIGANSGNATWNFSAGTTNVSGLDMLLAQNTSTAALNMSGTALLSMPSNFINMTPGGAANATINMNGGTILTTRIQKGNAAGTATVNFDGGTLKAAAHETAFMTGLNNVFVKDGGATIHTNGFNVTVGNALQLFVLEPLGGLTKQGFGTLTLTNNNTYNGNTLVSQGTLALSHASNNNLASSPLITVASGATLDVTGLSGGTIVLASGQTLGGSGTVLGAVDVGMGTILAPGSSPGTLFTGNENWAPGGTLQVEMNDVDAGAGTSPGWDLLDITSTLTLAGLGPGNEFQIELVSLTLGNVPGTVHDFSDSSSYEWLIVDADNAINTYSLSHDQFLVDTSGFSNPFTGTFSVRRGDFVSGDDTQLYLVYEGAAAVVPEPSTWALAALGLIGLGVFSWRRKRTARI